VDEITFSGLQPDLAEALISGPDPVQNPKKIIYDPQTLHVNMDVDIYMTWTQRWGHGQRQKSIFESGMLKKNIVPY
jgi:hypothetical protein